jgi:acetylornithine deacetylase/succinyl-diaminopimelate desuccinylase-like protein
VHSRLLVLIEASEESGSVDLPAHLEALGDRLGNISLVVCLDSGCDDYERLWNTTSLRGVVRIDLTVKVLAEGIHSGVASGIVPSSMRLMRQLLDRIEDVETGEVLVPEMHVPIPAHRITETATQARMRDAAHTWFPFAGATEPMGDDPTELLLNSTWRPTLSYIAAGGLPAIGAGGNVLRPSTTLSLSFRTPPGVDPDGAAAAAIAILTANPPNNATVHAALHDGAWGWDAPKVAPWLDEALTAASVRCFGNPPAAFGEGGSIPFMAMLGLRFPDAQFVVTGALGPDANAHGPNEYVHLPTAQRVAASIALVLDAEARRSPTHVH